MTGPQPFHGHVGQTRISPEQDAVLGGWQGGMGPVRDREADAERRSLGRAALNDKQEAQQAKQSASQAKAMACDIHCRDSSPRLRQEP